ncbi:MAG: hypothetical protein M1832_001897 [Thelocarpon impressellum]|nr:MAG: hypothetical protein M1832_001897 [Thelocarpon impressellum]
MGVVVDFMAAVKSRGTDYQCTFSLVDPTYDGSGPNTGLRVRFFRSSLDELPKIRGTGDVVALRNVKIKDWQGMTMALSSFRTEWTVFPAGGIPEAPGCGTKLVPSFSSRKKQPAAVTEQLYAIRLCNMRDRSTFTAPIEPPNPSGQNFVRIATTTERPRNRFSLIKDLAVKDGKSYHDLVGQVVKTASANSNMLELYVTDYTPNENLWDYEWGRHESAGESLSRDGDEYGYAPARRANNTSKSWPGPFGKLTMLVTLFEPHASFARSQVKVGHNVYLRNTYIRNPEAGSLRIEGSIYTDKRYSERIDVSIIHNRDDERVQKMLERKRAYWKKAVRQQDAFFKDAQSMRKRQHDGDGEPGSKTKKKRGKARKEESRVVETGRDEVLGPNKHVKCSHPAMNTLSLSEVHHGLHRDTKTPGGQHYQLPFHNVRFRARDAECLVGMTAMNLRKNPEALEELRQKLFVLWGELEERKSSVASTSLALRERHPNVAMSGKPAASRASSLAFDCCLQEYGVRSNRPRRGREYKESDELWMGWERRFKMWGTTIK